MRYKLVEHEILEGKVTAVHDGDSIKVVFPTETVWVRLYGCDAPEVISNYVSANQPFGTEAGLLLRDTVKGKTVKVETLFRDVYNRMICKVTLDGKDLTEFMVENGYAWWYQEPKMKPEIKERLKTLHNTAKEGKLGLWGEKGRKVRPTTWRSYNKRFGTSKIFEDLW